MPHSASLQSAAGTRSRRRSRRSASCRPRFTRPDWRSAPIPSPAPTPALLVEEEQCRLLAGNMTDVVTRHDRTAACCSPRPMREAVLGAPAGDFARPWPASTASILPTGRPIWRHCRMRRRAGRPAHRVPHAPRRHRRRAEHGVASSGSRCGAGRSTSARWASPVPAARGGRGAARRHRRKAQQEALIEARAEAERANAAKSRFLAM